MGMIEVNNLVKQYKMLNKIYSQQYVSQSELNYYTRSIHPDVAKVYGWPVRQRTEPEKTAMTR